ncbi:hypothetical protein T492DRAFT_1113975 [Pavlovales sp. CCMP2436]|nr:hypothetical protein T492DRAFT_1113975 [Pavlovales sp. CCMP2436]
MGSVDALNKDRLLTLTDTDRRLIFTHYLLNGQPYNGAMHPIFTPGKIALSYMSGARHSAFSEMLVYSKLPVIVDIVPREDLPRLPRETKNIFNSYKDAGVFDDMLKNTRGEAVLNRTIIPARMIPTLNGRERPFINTSSPLTAPRGAVAGGRGDQIFYSRVQPTTTVQGPPVIPDSSGVIPPGYMLQPPYASTQLPAQTAQDASIVPMAPMAPGGGSAPNLLAMVPRQVRRDTRRFQVNPSVTLAPFLPPPPLMTRVFAGPPLPPGFIRSPPGDTQSSESTSSYQQTPRLIYTPVSAGVLGPYVIQTSSVTQLSFSSSESPQNQTRDLSKIIKKKLPVSVRNDELVFPFDSSLFTAPLSYVAEVALPASLGLATTKAVGVQWSFSKTKPISAGCEAVLGDTKMLQAETMTDPRSLAFTINHIIPEDAVTAMSYQVTLAKFVPWQTQLRDFTWSSLDTPSMVCAKWKATMEPAVAYAGSTHSFGHAVLSFDNTIEKFVATFSASSEWGAFSGGIYYEIDRYSGSSNASKNNLGLNQNRPFANMSSCAYVRSGDVIDASKRITVDILATDFLFFVGDMEITRDTEGASSVTFYNQIYKSVLRICGDTIVSNEYTGNVSPISRLTVISNESRALTLSDFTNKRLPTTIGHDSFFSGDIIGRATNGDTYNVIDNLESLNTELLLADEAITILSCTTTDDSWLLTTDNGSSPFQMIATPAYNPTTINAINKASPAFASTSTISANVDWASTSGWRATSGSYYQNNASFLPWRAFDHSSSTFWASAETAFSASGVGSQWIKMEYPEAVEMVSHKIDPADFGVAKKVEEFFLSVDHVPYKYWQMLVTLVKTSNVSIHAVIYDVSFITGWSVGMTSLLSAQPVDLTSFKLILGNSHGVVVSMVDTPVDWQFNHMLTKNKRIVNSPMSTEKNNFKSNAINLARASYLSLDKASTFGDSLGFDLDRQLSKDNTLVFIDKRTNQPTIVHRGSVTPRDWLVDDVLIAAGSNHETQRLRRARQITAAAEVKYKTKSNAVGHSLGGRLAELAGSGGEIVTFNRASGLGDLGLGRNQPLNRNRNGTRQTDVRTNLDLVSALSSLGRRLASQPPVVVVRQKDQANRFLPGPIRFLANVAKAHSLKNLKRSLDINKEKIPGPPDAHFLNYLSHGSHFTAKLSFSGAHFFSLVVHNTKQSHGRFTLLEEFVSAIVSTVVSAIVTPIVTHDTQCFFISLEAYAWDDVIIFRLDKITLYQEAAVVNAL